MVKKRKTRKNSLIAKNKRLQRKLKEYSVRDALTGLYNYAYFAERLNTELKNAKRYVFPISLIIVDVDYFKSINDTYGYRTGNDILKKLGHYLKDVARISDIIVRYAGARFVILLHDTNKEGTVALSQRLCEKIQRHPFEIKKSKIKLKVSIGVSNYPEDGVVTVSDFMDAADQALRDAKDKGGNRVSAFEIVSKKHKVPMSKKEEIKDLRLKLRKAGRQLDQALIESIYAFAKTLEARDYYTGRHAERMIDIVRNIGKELGLSKKDIIDLEHAAVLHDLGKIGINDKILRKRGKLTKKEYEQIKKHPIIGAEILRPIHFFKDVIPLILYHHERYDGKGYAAGLKGKEIPLGARILAIADVYQALLSNRPYRKAFTKKEALKIIKDSSGKQFDPEVVSALFKAVRNKNAHI